MTPKKAPSKKRNQADAASDHPENPNPGVKRAANTTLRTTSAPLSSATSAVRAYEANERAEALEETRASLGKPEMTSVHLCVETIVMIVRYYDQPDSKAAAVLALNNWVSPEGLPFHGGNIDTGLWVARPAPKDCPRGSRLDTTTCVTAMTRKCTHSFLIPTAKTAEYEKLLSSLKPNVLLVAAGAKVLRRINGASVDYTKWTVSPAPPSRPFGRSSPRATSL